MSRRNKNVRYKEVYRCPKCKIDYNLDILHCNFCGSILIPIQVMNKDISQKKEPNNEDN